MEIINCILDNVKSSDEKTDEKGFFKELEELMDLVRDQLLERYEIQCNRHVYNFPFLMGQGIWMDSEKLKNTDSPQMLTFNCLELKK